MPHKERTASSPGSHSMTREQAEPFAVRQLQRDFRQMPARAQTDTLDRTLRLLRDEAQRKPAQPSALARLAERAYGIRTEDL